MWFRKRWEIHLSAHSKSIYQRCVRCIKKMSFRIHSAAHFLIVTFYSKDSLSSIYVMISGAMATYLIYPAFFLLFKVEHGVN